MGKKVRMGMRERAVAMMAVFASLALALCLVPWHAYAYYNFGTVGVSTGTSSLSVAAGQTTTTSVTINPSSSDQTLGCGMAKCPQICESDGAVEQGYHCFDVNGQCTCAGTSYSTYYPDVSAVSSNSGVATASVSGNTLTVTGVSAGTATITVNASLRQWTDGASTINVQVTQPASSSDPSTSGNSSAGTTGTSQDSSASSQAPAASAPVASADIPQEAASTDSRDDGLNETAVETVAGTVYTVENNSYLNTKDELLKIAGTGDQLVIWAGGSSTDPDYSWTFTGTDISADSPYLEFDPTITLSKIGTGNVANIVEQAKVTLVLDFAHEGPLPGPATMYVKASDVFSDGAQVNLYTFNADTNKFELAQEGLTVENGYVTFQIDHCSTWALSSDDLTAYEVSEVNTPGAREEAGDNAGGNGAPEGPIAEDDGGEGLSPAVIAAIAIVVLAAAAAIAYLVVRRKRNAGAGAEDSAGDSSLKAGDPSQGEEKTVSAQSEDETVRIPRPDEDATVAMPRPQDRDGSALQGAPDAKTGMDRPAPEQKRDDGPQ